MKKLIVLSEQEEVSGRYVLAFTENLNQSETAPILQRFFLEIIKPDDWYPRQLLLDVLWDIQERRTNVSQNLVALGMKVSETAAYPPEINSIETALQAVPIINALNHRNISNVDTEYEVRMLGNRHIQLTNHSPYPNDALYGFTWGLVKRFQPVNGSFKLNVVDRQAEDATFDIQWTE